MVEQDEGLHKRLIMSRRDAVEEFYGECLEESGALLADGFDDAIIGVVSIDGGYKVAYSEQLVIHQLIDNGMEYIEAREFYEFNIEGAYVTNGPVFIQDWGIE